MTDATLQSLRVLPGRYLIEHVPGGTPPPGGWIGLLRAPEGLTVIREPGPADGPGAERWVAIYGGGTPHDLDVPGMLAALLSPLASAGIPVFVASTFHADMVFVPATLAAAAERALSAAGHKIHGLTMRTTSESGI